MKAPLIFLLFISMNVSAKNVTDFNKVLIKDVQKDIRNDNDQKFRKNYGRMPASVMEEKQIPDIKINPKLENNVRQTGARSW